MHGGGSPEGAKLMVRLNMGLDQSINYARRLAGLTEPVEEPAPKK